MCDFMYILHVWKKLIPHPLYDPTDFGSLSDLDGITRKEGLVVIIIQYFMYLRMMLEC